MSDSNPFAEYFRKHIPPLAAVGAVAGFISDVVSPLAPVAIYAAFGLSLIALITFALNSLLKSKIASGIATVTAAVALCNALVALSQSITGTATTGIAGSSLQAIGQFQKTLGIVQSDIREIKGTVTSIQDSTAKMVSNSEKSLDTLKQIASGFDELINNGDLVTNPKTYEQFYANARKHAALGGYVSSVEAYKQAIKLSKNQIDPVLELVRLVKTKEGNAKAREELLAAATEENVLSVKTGLATTYNLPQALDLLLQVQQQAADYTPIYFVRAQTALSGRDTRDVSIRSAEIALQDFSHFLKSTQRSAGSEYLTDQLLFASWREEAQSSITKLKERDDQRTATFATVSGSDGNLCFRLEAREPVYTVALVKKVTAELFPILGTGGSEITPSLTYVDGGSVFERCIDLVLSSLTSDFEVNTDGKLVLRYLDKDGIYVTLYADIPTSEWSLTADKGSITLSNQKGLRLTADLNRGTMLVALMVQGDLSPSTLEKLNDPKVISNLRLRFKPIQTDSTRSPFTYQQALLGQGIEVRYLHDQRKFVSYEPLVGPVRELLNKMDYDSPSVDLANPDGVLNFAYLLDALEHSASLKISIGVHGEGITDQAAVYRIETQGVSPKQIRKLVSSN